MDDRITVLNLGCGTRASDATNVTNIDWSPYARIRNNTLLRTLARPLLSTERRRRLDALPQNVLCHNLSSGIPFGSETVDVVYHSHFLEHLDRADALRFLAEVKRVLKPGGIHRIVVPDFEVLCRRYLTHIDEGDQVGDAAKLHDKYISDIIEQSIRKTAAGASRQNAFVYLLEAAILGDARRRGETHQWMYDRITLANFLLEAGYSRTILQLFNSSLIPNWNRYALDSNSEGGPYQQDSLYLEAMK
jgi:SAM-dependent methyltransferase